MPIVRHGIEHKGVDDQSVSNDDQLTIKDGEMIINEDGDDVDFRVEASGAANALVVQGSDGNVGIGVAAPPNPLTVYGNDDTSAQIASFRDTGGNLEFQFYMEGDSSPSIYLGSLGKCVIKESGTSSFTGDVSLSTGSLVIGTAGQGIDFSAQTSAAAVSGVTVSSEVLNHYEEGTWSAAFEVTGGSGSVTIHGDYDLGSYTRTGRTVHVQGFFFVSSVSSPVGNLHITGLPFAQVGGSDGSDWGAITIWTFGAASDIGNFQARVDTSLSKISLHTFNGTTSVAAAPACTAGTYFFIGGSYTTA